jgi:hypothetical protein
MKILDNIRHHLRPVLSTFLRPFDGELQGLGLVGAEVGVFKGSHAKQLVNKSNVQTLYCIDPYVGYDDYPQPVLDEVKRKAVARLNFSSKVRWLFMDSTAATNSISSSVGALVYLDGDHSKASVAADIAVWWPLVKPGGVLGGHDFHHTKPGVIAAVTEWTVKNKLSLCVYTPDWWVRKAK